MMGGRAAGEKGTAWSENSYGSSRLPKPIYIQASGSLYIFGQTFASCPWDCECSRMRVCS